MFVVLQSVRRGTELELPEGREGAAWDCEEKTPVPRAAAPARVHDSTPARLSTVVAARRRQPRAIPVCGP